MDMYDSAKELLEGLRNAVERAEPLIDTTGTLIDSTESLVGATRKLVSGTRAMVEKTQGTLSVCDEILTKGPKLADDLGGLMRAQTALAEKQAELVTLEIERAKADL